MTDTLSDKIEYIRYFEDGIDMLRVTDVREKLQKLEIKYLKLGYCDNTDFVNLLKEIMGSKLMEKEK